MFCRIIAAGTYDYKYDLAPRHPGLEIVRFRPIEVLTPGHQLFVPVVHIPDAAEDPLVTGLLFETAARYARLDSPAGFNLLANSREGAGQTVFHVHVHYVPRLTGDGLVLRRATEKSLSAPVPV